MDVFGESRNRRRFVVLDVEDGVELGDLEQVVNLLGQVQQLQFASAFFTEVKALTISPIPELSM